MQGSSVQGKVILSLYLKRRPPQRGRQIFGIFIFAHKNCLHLTYDFVNISEKIGNNRNTQ